MPPVSDRETAAPVHHYLVLPVADDGGDNARAIPLGGPNCGLVLDPDLVSDLQLGERLAAFVIEVFHLTNPLCCH